MNARWRQRRSSAGKRIQFTLTSFTSLRACIEIEETHTHLYTGYMNEATKRTRKKEIKLKQVQQKAIPSIAGWSLLVVCVRRLATQHRERAILWCSELNRVTSFAYRYLVRWHRRQYILRFLCGLRGRTAAWIRWPYCDLMSECEWAKKNEIDFWRVWWRCYDSLLPVCSLLPPSFVPRFVIMDDVCMRARAPVDRCPYTFAGSKSVTIRVHRAAKSI